jgi:PAS domain S-box-containing protein
MQNEELRRTQRELETARERLALLYDAAPVGYLTIDSTAVIREANSTAADLLGCPHQQLAGRGLSRFVAPESQDAFHIFCGSMLAAEGKRAAELRFRRSDRSTFAGWLETHPEPPTPGEPPRFLLALTEITERIRAQEHLAQLAAIVESSNDAIIGQTLDGVVVSWNPASERIFGYSTGEMLGRPLHILVPPDHLDSLQAIGQRIRQGERIEHYDSVRITKDGRRIAVTVTTSPIKDVRGGIVGISTILRDITPHKWAEAARRQSEAALASFFDEAPLGPMPVS